MDKIILEGIEFYGYHGVSDQEQAVGHRYSIDVELDLDLRPAGTSDCLADTVNYSAIARRIVQIGTREQKRLVEALAETMAQALLDEYPAHSVTIQVRKVTPPMRVIAAAAGVRITRGRS